MTSDKINMIILYFRREVVSFVWCPWSDDSRFTSRHHRPAVVAIKLIIISIDVLEREFEWSVSITADAEESRTREATIGHGLGLTMWNGWEIFIISEFLYYIGIKGCRRCKLEWMLLLILKKIELRKRGLWWEKMDKLDR